MEETSRRAKADACCQLKFKGLALLNNNKIRNFKLKYHSLNNNEKSISLKKRGASTSDKKNGTHPLLPNFFHIFPSSHSPNLPLLFIYLCHSTHDKRKRGILYFSTLLGLRVKIKGLIFISFLIFFSLNLSLYQHNFSFHYCLTDAFLYFISCILKIKVNNMCAFLKYEKMNWIYL